MTSTVPPAFRLDRSTARKAGGALLVGAIGIAAAWKLGAFRPVTGCVRADAWPRELIALHVVGDALTFLPYVGIPLVLVLMIWRRLRARASITELLPLFGAFIILCGWTHLDDIIAIWWPAYWFTGCVKLATGIVSSLTLVKLIKLVPAILGLGSMQADLQSANAENERLRKAAEARAARAEGEVTELEQAQAKLREALTEAERERARAERLGRDALESARIAEAARSQAEAAISEKQAAMRAITALSTPVLPVINGVLLSPIIGTLDSERVRQLMDTLLHAVCERQARVAILDISGVEIVDSAVADALLQTCAAVKLIGGRCIITGVRPAVAQTMVQLRIDMPDIRTENTLELGLSAAMQIVRSPKSA